jgi:hypothetical protein
VGAWEQQQCRAVLVVVVVTEICIRQLNQLQVVVREHPAPHSSSMKPHSRASLDGGRGAFLRKPLSVAISQTEEDDEECTIERHLSLFDLVMVGAAGTVGSGVFALVGKKQHRNHESCTQLYATNRSVRDLVTHLSCESLCRYAKPKSICAAYI